MGVPRLWSALPLALITVLAHTPLAAQAAASTKAIKIGLMVEAEGPGGLFAQSGEDVSSQEIAELRTQIAERITGLKQSHRLVPADGKDLHLILSVVAEKVSIGRESWIVAGSALTVATKDGGNSLVTHDVIVAPSISAASKAIVYYLQSAEFHGAVGMKD